MSTHTGSKSSSPSSQNRYLRKERPPPPPLQKGSPVSFYLDGRASPYFGWLRNKSAANLYTVDLVGGGRMHGLEAVTPCSTQDIRKAEQLKHTFHFAESPYAAYDVIGQKGTQQLAPKTEHKFRVGATVSFTLEKLERHHNVSVDYPDRSYGRVQKVCRDGTYVIDVASGGKRSGVRNLAPCTEEEFEKMCSLKVGWKTCNDSGPFAHGHTRNAPAWGGSYGFSGGYRERSPPGHLRHLAKSVSVPVLLPVSTGGAADQKRSLSPQLRRHAARTKERAGLQEGSPVSFYLEGQLEPLVGWIHHFDADGTCTVETTGGRRVVGIREVIPSSTVEIERSLQSRSAVLTRKDPMDEFTTRNRPTSRSPSPVPRLRGVVINALPRSATQM
jgi:hypothetical protein